MGCCVCGSEAFDKETGECRDCGFESPAVAGMISLEEFERIVKAEAEEYRNVRRKRITVGLKIFTYWKKRGGELEEEKEKVIVLSLPDGGAQKKGVQWYDEKFAAVSAGREMVLNVVIKDSQGKEEIRKVSLKAPDWGTASWKIGYLEEEKLHFYIVLGACGEEEKILKSERISMICG